MPIASPIGYLDVVNATLRASQVEAVSRLSVANTATTQSFSVGERFHVNKDSVDPVSITGNVVASGVKIGNLSISPAFDFASVSNVGNVTANVIQFANATTGFVTSSNVEIGGNISLTANAQVKIGSNVLAEYTGPHGREPKEVPLKKYPEIAFDASKLDGNDTTNTYTQAGYTVTADSQITECKAYKAFDNKFFVNGSDLNRWQTSNNGYYGSTADTTTGPVTTLADSTTKRGSYIQLESPHKIIVSRYVIWAQENSDTFRPKKVILLGSNTGGTDWVSIDPAGEVEPEFVSTGTFPASTMATVSFTNTTAYKYHRLVVRANNGGTVVLVQELELYGREEPSPVGDLSLDTTLKSTFNSVRSNNYVMYFDGEGFDPNDTNSNNLVTGSSVSVVHHNATYDSTGKYWTLDGSTESNVTTGDLGFEGDVPHTVSMWVNASNVEDKQLFSIGSGYDKSFLKVDDTQIAANTWHNVTYAYQGEGGSKVTYVDGRKVEEAQVEDTFGVYPPFSMTDYRQGGFVVTASSELNQTSTHDDAYKMFNKTNDNTSYWTPVAGSDYSTSDGSFVVPTTGSFTQPNWHFLTNGVGGHWVQIKMPYKIKVEYVKLASSDLTGRHAKDATIFGSNDDGKTWYTVGSWTNNNANNYDLQTFVMDTSEYYNTYRMVVTRSGNSDTITLTELQFYGHKEGDLTRFPEPTRVLKYPHIAMTGPGQRGYVATASAEEIGNSRFAWSIFDGDDNTQWGSGNATYGADPYNVNTNLAITLITLADSTTRRGHWIKLELPRKLYVTSYYQKALVATRRPDSVCILGSNDDSNWYVIKDSHSVPNQDENTISVNAGTAYKYIKYVVESISGADDRAVVNTVNFYGTEEDTGTPAIVGGPFAGKVANFRVYDTYLGEERIQEIYDAQKDAFGHKKSSMTFYKGRIGVGTTEPEGALTIVDEPHAMTKFPERAISSDDGEITIRTADGSGYQAFDGLATTTWRSTPERHTRLSEEVDFGAWLKIETPDPISLKKALIQSYPDWVQVGTQTYGGSIDNTTANEHFGRAIAVSHDGTRVIVGAFVSNSWTGKAEVYDWNGTEWTKVGQTLTGYNSGDHFGHTVAISGDGNIIAVGAPYEHTTSLADAGSVRVYYLNGSTWNVLPDSGTLTNVNVGNTQDTFQGVTASGLLGLAGTVKLSYDGYTVAMCEYGYGSGGLSNRGRVQVFTYTNGAWSQKGTDFLGVYSAENFGRGIDMSEDGNHLIISTRYQGNNTTNGPRVEVYKWNASASVPAWEKKGITLGAEVGWADGYGAAVSISNDGNTIAIGIMWSDVAEGGTATDTGSVDVYHWDGSAWGPTGSGTGIQAALTAGYKLTKVFDKISDTRFGDSVSLSGDGKRLIVSESHADYDTTNGGRLYTFEYTGVGWILRDVRNDSNVLGPQIGADGRSSAYLGMGINHNGQGLAISRDGSTIVGGEHFYATNGQNGAGAVRVFQMPSNIKSIWGSNDNENWTKITTAPTREEATSNVAGFQFGYDDRLEIKNLDNPIYYKYHAIVADAFTRLKDIKLFGVRKQGSSTLHDGQLTLMKNLTVPRIGPALDADDTPRRDRLVVEYNTSTNPMEDGVVQDTSGRGLDGVFTTGASYEANKKALTFNGATTSGISIGGATGVGGDRPFSVSLWFNASALTGGVDNVLVGWGAQAPRESFLMSFDTTNNQVLGQFYGNGMSVSPSGGINLGNWYHAVLTYPGGGHYNMSIYVNGVKGTNTNYGTNSGGLVPEDSEITIGTYKNASNQGFNGSISNFKLYDTTLTAQEVKTLYDMGRCDEGGHVVNFSKTRVGIGLGDGEAPQATLDVRGRIMREYNPGEIIEELNTVCNGRPVTVLSGTYTPTNVTAFQTSSSTHTEINGSNITYNKPAGAKRIYYKFACQWDDNSLGAITNFKIRVYHNGAWRDINPSRYTHAAQYVNDGNNHGSAWVINEYIFECDADTESQHDGRFLSSKTSYTFDVTWRHHGGGDGSNYNSILHMNQWWDGTGTDILHPPQLTIRAIA